MRNIKQKILFRIGEADIEILKAINNFQYMTADQISRLLYPLCSDQNRYSQRRLRRLADAEYLLRLRALPTPRYGSAPFVFTLGHKGRRFLDKLGVNVPSYFRPSEEREKAENNPFMKHTLQTIDVLISALQLCRNSDVVCYRMLLERELKKMAVRVAITSPDNPTATAKETTAIPDAWFQLRVGSNSTFSVALELDRGTEDQKRWRHKIAVLASWANGPYKEAFETDNLTIAVVTPSEVRLEQLRHWTMQELVHRSIERLSDIFLFTDASPISTTPTDFYFGKFWLTAHNNNPISLLDFPYKSHRKILYDGVL